MAKVCNQKDHKWEVIQQFPYRCKCTICGVIGKIYGSKLLPLKGNDTVDTSKNYNPAKQKY